MVFQGKLASLQLFCDMCKQKMKFNGATGTNNQEYIHYICPICFHRNSIKKVMQNE